MGSSLASFYVLSTAEKNTDYIFLQPAYSISCTRGPSFFLLKHLAVSSLNLRFKVEKFRSKMFFALVDYPSRRKKDRLSKRKIHWSWFRMSELDIVTMFSSCHLCTPPPPSMFSSAAFISYGLWSFSLSRQWSRRRVNYCVFPFEPFVKAVAVKVKDRKVDFRVPASAEAASSARPHGGAVRLQLPLLDGGGYFMRMEKVSCFSRLPRIVEPGVDKVGGLYH